MDRIFFSVLCAVQTVQPGGKSGPSIKELARDSDASGILSFKT